MRRVPNGADIKVRSRKALTFGKEPTWARIRFAEKKQEFAKIESEWSETGPTLQRILPEYDWSKPVWLESWIETALSFREIGIMAHLLSRPETWITHVWILSQPKQFREGRDSIRSSLKRLRELRYVSLVNERQPNGQIKSVYYIFADPAANNQKDVWFGWGGVPAGDPVPDTKHRSVPTGEHTPAPTTGFVAP